MKKKGVMLCLFLTGVIFGGCFSTKVLVHSSEKQSSITPDVPEEEKSYYVENEQQLKQEKEKKNEYKVRYYTLSIQKAEYQEIYLQALKEELEEKLRIENGKLGLGYTVHSSVEELEIKLKDVQSQIESVQTQKKNNEEVIQIYGTMYAPMQLPEDLPVLNDNYLSAFLESNLQIKYYDNQIKKYQEYLNEYEGADNYDDIRIQRDLAELDKKQYAADLQVYVKEKELHYQNILQEIAQINSELALLNEKIKTNRSLLEKGKITKVQLIELDTEQKRLVYEKMNLICDGECIKYVLEKKIEGIEL